MDIGFSGFRKVIELGMMSRWPIHRSDGGAYGLRDQEYLRLKVLTCMLPAL
jgi:hypothetical protein